MRLYLAGVDAGDDCEMLGGLPNLRYLISYYYIKNHSGRKVVDYGQRTKTPLLLDSGGFSAFASGKAINLVEYIDYCGENKDAFEIMTYLDVIGNAEKSSENYAEMRRAGIEGMPTYHVGTDWRFFEKLIAEWDYVAVGGMVPYLRAHSHHYRPALYRALVRIHKAAKDSGTKLHGFGVTSWQLMVAFPWYSVDSTSWLAARRFGRVCVIKHNGQMVSVSAREKPEDVLRTAKKIGYNGDLTKLIPKRNQPTEQYKPILRYNAHVLLDAAKRIHENNSNR
jgi:hypothetical protein